MRRSDCWSCLRARTTSSARIVLINLSVLIALCIVVEGSLSTVLFSLDLLGGDAPPAVYEYSGSGWTGSINPNGYASPAIALGSSSVSLNNCVFRYAASALQCGTSSSGYSVSFSHLQFLKCGKAIELYSGNGMYNTLTVNLNNALLSQVQYPFYMPSFPYSLVVNLAHTTIDQANRLFLENGSFTLRATNSIFANITNSSTGTFVGAYNGFWSSAQSFGAAPLTVYSSPFSSVGAGNYYLSDTSGFRNYCTTSGLPATLLSDLKKRTTYPPIIVAGTTWNTSQTLAPQAQRDTDAPDLGWHPAGLVTGAFHPTWDWITKEQKEPRLAGLVETKLGGIPGPNSEGENR